MLPMQSSENTEHCEVCGREFRYTPKSDHRIYIPAYQIMVCSICYATNSDGWAPQFEESVTRNLKAKGLKIPARNANGLLPRNG